MWASPSRARLHGQTNKRLHDAVQEEIGLAVVDMLAKHHKAVEGAAGLGIAGFRKVAHQLQGKTVAIVVCGGNVDAKLLKTLLCQFLD